MPLITKFNKIKQNYNYLTSNLSGYTKNELICLRISFIGFFIYALDQLYAIYVPHIFMIFWAISLFFLAYATIRSSARNFKECYILLIQNSFPVKGKIYIFGSIFLKMAPKGAKYMGGVIGLASGLNYFSVEFFEISPAREFSKYIGWYSPSIETTQAGEIAKLKKKIAELENQTKTK